MEIPLTGWDRPVLIAQGTADDMVPYAAVVSFSRSLCDAGGKVTLKVYEGAAHSGPMNTGPPEFTKWVAARFSGEPAGDTCATGG